MPKEDREYLEGFASAARSLAVIYSRREGWADCATAKENTAYMMMRRNRDAWDDGQCAGWAVAWGF